LTLSSTPFNDDCNQGNGILIISANGGNQGYTYDIGNGPTSNNQFFNLYAGSYTATVTDANGCNETTTAVIGNDPPPTANAGAGGTLDCLNPSIELNGSSSAPVSYGQLLIAILNQVEIQQLQLLMLRELIYFKSRI
jgi:hypothetical protein